MDAFQKETVERLARVEEQQRAVVQTLDRINNEMASREKRLRGMEFSHQYGKGVVAVVAAIGSVAGGCAVWILQKFFGGA